MVSRVYTPPYKPYARNGGTSPQASPSGANEENPAASAQVMLRAGVASGPVAPSPTGDAPSSGNMAYGGGLRATSAASSLQSVQYDQRKAVPINAVLNDFQNTMGALGTDEPTRAEVGVYLQAISLQSTKNPPDVQFIKGTLRTAANTLDQYIGTALNKPSNVVREWVDALLMQNIDFHSDMPFKPEGATSTPQVAGGAAEIVSDPAPQAPVLDRQQLKAFIEGAKASQKAGDITAAEKQLQQALAQLPAGQYPDWEGKIHNLRGRFAQKSGNWDDAVDAYQTAGSAFAKGGFPAKQADSLHAAASLLEDKGHYAQAQTLYGEVHQIDSSQGDIPAQIKSLQAMGRIDLRLGQAGSAISRLNTAASLLPQAGEDVSATLRSDLFATLGTAYRNSQQASKAVSAFGNAARAAKQSGDTALYAQSLRQFAAVLVEDGQSDRAMKALQALKATTSAKA